MFTLCTSRSDSERTTKFQTATVLCMILNLKTSKSKPDMGQTALLPTHDKRGMALKQRCASVVIELKVLEAMLTAMVPIAHCPSECLCPKVGTESVNISIRAVSVVISIACSALGFVSRLFPIISETLRIMSCAQDPAAPYRSQPIGTTGMHNFIYLLSWTIKVK